MIKTFKKHQEESYRFESSWNSSKTCFPAIQMHHENFIQMHHDTFIWCIYMLYRRKIEVSMQKNSKNMNFTQITKLNYTKEWGRSIPWDISRKRGRAPKISHCPACFHYSTTCKRNTSRKTNQATTNMKEGMTRWKGMHGKLNTPWHAVTLEEEHH